MLEPEQHTPNPVLRKVVGWVLVLPLLASFVTLPFPLSLFLVLGVIAASAYGVRLAVRHASRRVTVFALIVTVLNVISLVLMGTASVLMALYSISRLY
ncbi:hypothetical protein ALQ18_01196 [Pseudomonas marginalis pv. marginalis]|nr:hypothetical protein ALQ18_01196 [Pseudomonas marginalis pv. marginalis]